MYKRHEILQLSPRFAPATEAFWLHVSRGAMVCRFEITLNELAEVSLNPGLISLDDISQRRCRISHCGDLLISTLSIFTKLNAYIL